MLPDLPSQAGPDAARDHEEHWHGATADRFMPYVAMQEADENGQVVTWGDHVTDEEYGRIG